MLDAVAFLQLLDDRFFGNGLTRRHARKLGFDGRAVDNEFACRWNPCFPVDRLDLLEQILKFQGFKLCHFNLHPICGPQPEVGAYHRTLIAQECDLAVLRSENLVAERLKLALGCRFQSEGRCCNDF